MSWRVVLTRRAERDLEDLPESVRRHILDVIRQAAEDPSSVSLAKLKGRPGEWRLRSGGWRIIVELNARTGQMIVTRVLQRKDAYR